MRAEPREPTYSLDLARELGQFLVQRGWLSPEDLQRARAVHQRKEGGLDSALLELGLIHEDRLLETLSEILRVPAAVAKDLRNIPKTAHGLLPRKVAIRHRAIPFRVVGGELWVAMAEVQDLAAQDEVAAVAGRRLRPHGALEVRIAEALQTYYQHPCPPRFEALLERLQKGAARTVDARTNPADPPPEAVAWEPTAGAAAEEVPPAEERAGIQDGASTTEPHLSASQPEPPQTEAPPPEPPAASDASPPEPAASLDASPAEPKGPDGEDPAPTAEEAAEADTDTGPGRRDRDRPRSIPLTAREREELAAVRRTPGKKTKRADSISRLNYDQELSEAEWAELEGRLHRVKTREDIGRVVLGMLALRFRRALFLMVQDGKIQGWMGQGIDQETVRGFQASLAERSVFFNIDRGVAFHLGPLPDMPVHRDLARIWGGSMPGTALVMPVRVRGRLVAFLYGDRSRPEPSAIDLNEMHRLVAACSSAFELYLMRRKLRKA